MFFFNDALDDRLKIAIVILADNLVIRKPKVVEKAVVCGWSYSK